ncbi:unnamed protein product, partial [Rotaria magnacalcarata]
MIQVILIDLLEM